MASVQEMNVVGDGIHYEISAVLSDPITTVPPTWYQRGWYHCYSTLWPRPPGYYSRGGMVVVIASGR